MAREVCYVTKSWKIFSKKLEYRLSQVTLSCFYWLILVYVIHSIYHTL